MAKWGEVIDGVKHYPLHSGQMDVLRSKTRFTAAIAGTGGGKTVTGPLWIMELIGKILASGRDLEDDPMQFMVVAPTYKILARATAPTLIRAFKGTDFEGVYIPTRNLYILPGGMGEIWILSADSPGGLEGGQMDGIWVDEGGQIKYDAWIAIQGRTGLKQAPVLITTTPYGQNWLFHDFYKKWRLGDPHYYCRQWSSIANPAYAKAEYDRAKGSMGAQRAAMRYDGEFVKMAGLVYPDLDSCKVPLDSPLHQNIPRGKLVGGIDFGWNHPFCSLVGTHFIDERDGKDKIFIWYERYKRMTSSPAHAKALRKAGRRRARFWADPSRPDLIAEFRKADIVVNKALNSKILGIDAVNERIYTQRLLISENCKAVFAESEQYAYPSEDDETYGEEPVKGFDDAMDTLRYLITGVDKRRIARPGNRREEFSDAA